MSLDASLIAKSRRRTELGLIVIGAFAVGGAYALASLGRTASLPANIGPFLGVIVALVLVAHLAVRRYARCADGLLLPVAGLLNGLGYVVIARLDHQLASRQAIWSCVGVAAFIATLMIVRRGRDLQRYRYTLLLVGIVLLMLPMSPLGRDINGARVWIALGPMSFQPGEIAKLCLVIFIASYLVSNRELLGMATWPKFRPFLPHPKYLGPLLAALAIGLAMLVVQNDFGQSLLIITLFIIMLWVGTGRGGYLFVGFIGFAAGMFAAVRSVPHVRQRFDVWLHPWATYDKIGGGYQIAQGAYALAWGGLAGTGLGLGSPGLIPEAQNDFIFAVIGEELGLAGTTIVLVAFLVLIGAGLRVATHASDRFDSLLAVGLTTLLGFQSFIIIAGVTRVLPLTGVALPFVSYGGSSVLASYILLALLVRVSDESTSRDHGARRERAMAAA
ncbi:MAG: FtsW/RodA/SpoVE family cell cycle protein [Actinobacteria bacterium]|nr:FtsW/RodA/SpoVE family cell cycle protein [Actinomycetota bacterium]